MTMTELLSGEAIAFAPSNEMKATAGETGEGLYVLAARNSPADWREVCIKRIDQLRELQPNWDSYGANPVGLGSIEVAKQLIPWLAQFTGIECPRIAASPAGRVSLSWEWEDSSRELDLEILPDGTLRFSYVDENSPIADTEGETADPNRIVQLLTQW